MISAKLMKELEKLGFRLDFPAYDSNEERIIEVIKEKNSRLKLAIPLLLQHRFDYNKIKNRLGKEEIGEFKKIIIISGMIYKILGIDNEYLKDIINQDKLRCRIGKDEFKYYYDSFKESLKNSIAEEESKLEKDIKIRGTLNLNKALSTIYSPGKLRIMDKIFNHEKLSNSELKYYYRSIRPLILAILNENLQKYIRIIESSKKYS